MIGPAAAAVIPTFEKSIINWIPDDDAANDVQSYNLGGSSNAACLPAYELCPARLRWSSSLPTAYTKKLPTTNLEHFLAYF